MAIHVIQPRSEKDKQDLFRFLYEIWSDEFSRSIEGMDHQTRLIKDVLDDTAQHFVAVDQSGQILGCLRSNILGQSSFSEDLQEYLKIEELGKLLGDDKVCYASHFTIAPVARGRTVASLLIAALFRHSLENGVDAGISYCALRYVSFYYQLGYRPYTGNFRTDAGIRVPLVHCTRDWTYLNEIKSPLLKLTSKSTDDRGTTARKIGDSFSHFKRPSFSRKKNHHLWARLAHSMPNDTKTENADLLHDLTEQERQIVSRRVLEFIFAKGERVYLRGETEQGMGLLLSGSLGVEVTIKGVSRIINVIQPGEPFGEILSCGRGSRIADLVALEESQTVLFPEDFLDRVCRADSKLGLKLSKRLLKLLSSRFMHFADVVAQTTDFSPDRNNIKQTSHYKHPDSEEMTRRIESYRFDSLGDQEGEFKRLIAQATIGEEIEFSVLNSIGLQDKATVLDLGSGPGVTSLLMAKRLPVSTIIGVEPEDLLRAKAEKLIASQGYSERCRFLRGTGDKIPLDNGVVDFSYARLLFQHLPNPGETLMEMKRVTRQGGIIAVLDVDDRSNIVHPAPQGLNELEERIVTAQAHAGGDRHIGRKLHGYLHDTGLKNVSVESIPITALALGREQFFSIVYSFKRQVLERAGELDEQTTSLFQSLEKQILKPETFAMTTVFLAHGVAP